MIRDYVQKIMEASDYDCVHKFLRILFLLVDYAHKHANRAELDKFHEIRLLDR